MDVEQLLADRGVTLGDLDASLRRTAGDSMVEYENFVRTIGGPGHGSRAAAGMALLKDDDKLMTHIGSLLNNAHDPADKRRIMGQLVQVGNNSSSAAEVITKLSIANQIAGAANAPEDEYYEERLKVQANTKS